MSKKQNMILNIVSKTEKLKMYIKYICPKTNYDFKHNIVLVAINLLC